MQNIEIILKIRELARESGFKAEEISIKMDVEETTLDEMIEKQDGDVIEYLQMIDKLNVYLKMLTEDLKISLGDEGFEVEDFDRWVHQIAYNGMHFVGLFETFQNAVHHLEFCIIEIIRCFRILTQNVYGEESESEMLC